MFWSMSGQFWQILGIVAVIVLVATLLARPAGILAMVLAVGVVVAAVIVTWTQVDTYRTQKAVGTPQPEAAAGVTVPPPGNPRSGT
jgi:predicted membrane protein